MLRLRTSPSLALLAALAASGPVVPAAGEPTDVPRVRGMTISCQTSGWEWGTDGFGAELDELARLGVNWVAIHPYAGIRADGSVVWRGLDGERPPAHVVRPIEEARRRGMSILIKPHLAYWSSPFRWRGEIAFEDPAARERFWATYREWIVALAGVAREADAFVVGTELDGMLDDEKAWRGLIAEVRGVTDAHLTYASNWSDYQRVPFWDDLDAIGVQAYFPISEAEEPGEEELSAGWRRIVEPLRELSLQTGKPVVMTEIGYNVSLDAARTPWSHGTTRGEQAERARALQARCLRAALETLEAERKWLRGAFLWKWFVGAAPGENFLVDTPSLRRVVREAWLDRAERQPSLPGDR